MNRVTYRLRATGRALRGAAWRIERLSRTTDLGLTIENAVATWSERHATGAPAPEPSSDHLLIPTVGMGNIGDQAMFEAFLEQTAGSVTVVVSNEKSHVVPSSAKSRVRFVMLPGLVDRPWWRNRNARQKFYKLAEEHRWISVIGADIMDGGYDPLEAIARWNLLRVVSKGQPGRSRVLAFSWNGMPSRQVQRAVVASSRRFVSLNVRDGSSLERLNALPEVEGVLVADMVFLLDQKRVHGPTEVWLAQGESLPIAVVNASGLLLTRTFLLGDYIDTVSDLLARGYRVILVPHVLRESDDDARACGLVADRFADDERIFLVSDLLAPSQVAWLVSRAEVVLTGRMHLAILALSQCVPAAVVSTQGKVTGMLAFFGLGQYSLEPELGFGKQACAALRALGPEAVEQIARALPSVRVLARSNFDGMDSE